MKKSTDVNDWACSQARTTQKVRNLQQLSSFRDFGTEAKFSRQGRNSVGRVIINSVGEIPHTKMFGIQLLMFYNYIF